MSSRADYLAKYMGGKPEKKRKKPKKVRESATLIVIAGQPQLPKVDKEEETLLEEQDPEDEFAPVGVELAAPRENKGFKRIDNGEVVKAETVKPQDPEDDGRGQTVYRDSSGRIVDLEQRRKELQAEKEQKAQEEEQKQLAISTGEADALRQAKDAARLEKATRLDVSVADDEYVQHRKAQLHFDDPLAQFGEVLTTTAKSETGRPVFQGGAHPANRFNIKAGHFWDGIDRSNGFENKLLKKRSENYVKKYTERASKESYTEYDFE